MSARWPFARVVPHKATQGVLPPGKDYEVNGWQVVGYAPLDGVFYMFKEHAESAAAAINAAHADRVAAELEAAAEAIMEKTEYPCCEATLENAVDIVRARAKAIREGGGK